MKKQTFANPGFYATMLRMKQANDIFNEYDTTVDIIEKYILTNTIQVNMAETRFYKNLYISKRNTLDQGIANSQESMVLKAARFRIYNSDSRAVFTYAEKVRKAEEVKSALETMKNNSATKHELNKRFKEWKENSKNYSNIMIAIGESQIERLHEFGLSLEKLTSQKEGFEHVKDVLENAVQEGKISPGQVMSFKLGTWRFLSTPNFQDLIIQKNKTAFSPDNSISPKTPEALLAAKVTLEKIIKRCGYPAGTPVQPSKITPLLNLAQTKGFVTKEERPIFEKALQPLLDAASVKEE